MFDGCYNVNFNFEVMEMVVVLNVVEVVIVVCGDVYVVFLFFGLM